MLRVAQNMILVSFFGSKDGSEPLEFLSFVQPNHSNSTEDEVRSRMLARKKPAMSFQMQTKHLKTRTSFLNINLHAENYFVSLRAVPFNNNAILQSYIPHIGLP